jgi:hypothetical protein
MPTVFDNIDMPFLENEARNGLKDALAAARRWDFCVGYFNLCGWRCIDAVVNFWPLPASDDDPPPCRLLVGMLRLPHEQLAAWLAEPAERPPDNKRMAQLRKDAAREFRKQLTLGHLTEADEAGLRRFASIPEFQHILGTFPLVDESVESQTLSTYRDLVKPGKSVINSIPHHHP